MEPILCPYCTQVSAPVVSFQATFPSHGIAHNGLTEFCPFSGATVGINSALKNCPDCNQKVRMLSYKGREIPEGHNFSWESDGHGGRMKTPALPEAGFYSKVWCNSQTNEQPIYISERFYGYQPRAFGDLVIER